MSVITTGSSYIQRNTLPVGNMSYCAWILLPTEATINNDQGGYHAQVSTGDPAGYLGFYGNSDGPSSFAVYANCTGATPVDTTIAAHMGIWVFLALSLSGTNLALYSCKEGAVALTTRAALTTWPAAITQASLLFDTFIAAKNGAKFTSVKVWSAPRSAAQLLAESHSRAPVDATNIYSYLGCAVGSTIGQDQSGNGNNWTITGAGLSLSPSEPSGWQSTASSLFFGAGQ